MSNWSSVSRARSKWDKQQVIHEHGSCCPKPDFWKKYNFTSALVDFLLTDFLQRNYVCPNQIQTGFRELWHVKEKKLLFLKWKDTFSKVKCFDKFVLISLAINICSALGKMSEDRLTGLNCVCRAEDEQEGGYASCSFSAITSSGILEHLWTCSIPSRTEKGVSGH